jgi:O-antigen ligase
MLVDVRPYKGRKDVSLGPLAVGGLAVIVDVVAVSGARNWALATAAVVVGIGSLYMILRRPSVMIYIALGWLVFEKAAEAHLSVDPGTIDALGNDVLATTLGWTLLVNLFRRREPLFTMRQIGPPLMAFVGLGVASTIVNGVPVSVASQGILSPTHSMLIFLCIVNLALAERELSQFVYIALAIMTVIGMVAVLQAVPGSPAWHLAARPPERTAGGFVRVSGIFENAISLGDFLALIMPLGLMLLFFGDVRGRPLAFLLIANLTMFLAMLATFSREAWGGLLIGALVLGLTVERKLLHATLRVVLPALLVLGLVLEPVTGRLLETIRGNLRFTLFQDTLPIIRDHLWLGVGPGRFGGHIALITDSPLYAQYHFPPFHYATGGQLDMFWTHTVAETGILGTATYVAIIITCFVVGKRAYREAINPRHKALLLGFLYVIPVAIFVSFVSSALEASSPATLFWALMGMLTLLSGKQHSTRVASAPVAAEHVATPAAPMTRSISSAVQAMQPGSRSALATHLRRLPRRAVVLLVALLALMVGVWWAWGHTQVQRPARVVPARNHARVRPTTAAALAAQPTILFNPNALQFGTQPLHTMSAVTTIHLVNLGLGTFTITGVTISGPAAADFSARATCPAPPVTAYEDCVVDVRFAPRARGIRRAVLIMTDNAMHSPHTMSLQGLGASV